MFNWLVNEEQISSNPLIKIKVPKAEKKLAQLKSSEQQKLDLASKEEELEEFCDRVKRNLDGCSFSNKKLALEVLNAQVIATREQVDIRIAVPLEFITIEQRSGCMLNHNKNRRSTVSIKPPVY